MTTLPDNLPLAEVPYRNPRNRWLNPEFLTKLFAKFGIDAIEPNLKLYQQAFIHESYILTPEIISQAEQIDLNDYGKSQLTEWAKAIPMQSESYERLEFLGDSILCAVMAEYLCKRYPKQDQGFLTKLRIELVKKETLSKLTDRLKWGEFLILARDYESHRYSDISLMEDVFESFIGALYLDFGGSAGTGLRQAYNFIINIIERYLDLSRIIYRDDNYKYLLLQYYHKTFDGQFPHYCLITNKDKHHQREFTAGVLNIDGHVIVTASDQKKIKAEQKASRKALIYYGQEVCSSSEDEDPTGTRDSD